MNLLEQLCKIPAPSGGETLIKDFLLDYIHKHSAHWHTAPEIISGRETQDCILLVFGKPRTAVFAHMDSVGFTVRYFDQLLPIGSPDAKTGTKLVGTDSLGPVICELEFDQEDRAHYKFGRPIDRGTSLTYQVEFSISGSTIQSAYLDNRVGVYNALLLAETIENGIIAFSCWEEHGGGSVPVIARLIHERWKITQALVSDVTWVTDGVRPGEGVAISMRDRNIPRQSYVSRIIALATESGIPFQLEVEGSGASDGRELQLSPYPVDWCFIGAPQLFPHSPEERIEKSDVESMTALYRFLMKRL